MLIVQNAADALAAQGQVAEDDVALAREASAFYLKLSESVLVQLPGHLPLAEAVAGGFTQYAYAFVAFEAERLESQDARAAKRLRDRAARLYWRAHRHAMAALEQRHPALAQRLSTAASMEGSASLQLAQDEVGVAYWSAASWAAYIALSKDRPDVVADLPAAVRLAELAWTRDPNYGAGALASLMGTFEAARPGGRREAAEAYFNQALTIGAGLNAGPYVAKAEAIALPSGNRHDFEALLRQAFVASAARPDLANEVMRARAQWLLDTADDRF